MAIAQAFGQYLKDKHHLTNPKVLVSGDGRQSLPELFPAVLSGLKSVGCDVAWAGTVPTPFNYFGFHHGDFDAAVQISASHNPAGDNGLKLTDRHGAVCGEAIQTLRKQAQCRGCLNVNDTGECLENCKPIDLKTPYWEKIKHITPAQKPLKILLDAGNAVPGIFYPQLLREFGHEVTEMFCELDTTFPNHQPDPERPENLRFAQEKLATDPHDLALVFDGDGDRVGIILADGTALSADKILFVLAADFLQRHPGVPIVVDAMSSQALVDKLEQNGAKVVMAPTGHSNIEHAMTDHQALLGGEQSGHFMFGENFYGHDDALLATLRFIQAIQAAPPLIEAVTSQWPQLLEVSERVAVDDDHKFEILKKVSAELKEIFPDANTMDGIRIDFGQQEWAIIRCSNTSPKIAVRIEALNERSLLDKKSQLLGVLQKHL